MTVKPSAAFALGLWAGAVVVAAVGAFYLRGLERTTGEPSPQMAKQLQDETEQIQQLRQEQARLLAEDMRLRQTISELKSNLDAGVVTEATRSADETRRRIPFRSTGETPVPAPAEQPADESWIADAVANGDVNALPQLQTAALHGSEAALDALALLADRDNGDALTRVWMADSLSVTLRVRAARLLAVTLEVNPRGEQLLQILFVAQDTDSRQIAAALEGLVDPSIPTTLDVAVSPKIRPDFLERLRLVDILRAQVTDTNVLSSLNNAREELVALASQGGWQP